MIRVQFYEDHEIGDVTETLGRTITESDIVTHAGQTGDFFPHHVDAEWCKTQPFGQRIAHGTLVFSVAIGLTAMEINPESMSYGYDRIRFTAPVYIGDTIRVRVTVTEKRPHHKKTDHGVVTKRVEVTNQDSVLVMVCEHLHLVRMRGSGYKTDHGS